MRKYTQCFIKMGPKAPHFVLVTGTGSHRILNPNELKLSCDEGKLLKERM